MNRGVTPGNDKLQHVDSILKGVAQLTGRSEMNLVKGRDWYRRKNVHLDVEARMLITPRQRTVLANENREERGSGAFVRGLTEISSLDSYVSARVHCLVVVRVFCFFFFLAEDFVVMNISTLTIDKTKMVCMLPFQLFHLVSGPAGAAPDSAPPRVA